jgi:DNA-binding LytR/AlgR family response regulator
MQIRCIAIDDEPPALAKLKGYIGRIPELLLLETFDTALAAMSWLRENRADLIFLDIEMEGLTGIQFIEAATPQAAIIIISAYDQYAVKGFDLNVTDYILKPYSFERFAKAVNRMLTERPVVSSDTHEEENFIFVKTEYRLEKVDLGKILYVEGMSDYLRIVCTDKKIMTLQSFGRMEEILPKKRFCRVHKSYIVAIDRIDSVERNIIKIGTQRIPVSITYRSSFFSRIKMHD